MIMDVNLDNHNNDAMLKNYYYNSMWCDMSKLNCDQ